MPDIRDRVRSTGQKEQENREKEAKGLLYEAQLLIDELNRRKREDKLKYYSAMDRKYMVQYIAVIRDYIMAITRRLNAHIPVNPNRPRRWGLSLI